MAPSRSAVYHMQNGRWQQLPELPGSAEELEVSASGKVWALIWQAGTGNQFARLDGPSWRIFQLPDAGARGVHLASGVVVDGEDLWAATPEGVVHWDGSHWTRH